jgi:L-fuculose-phosphate aldolase
MNTKSTRSLIHPADELVATMDRIYRYRMTTTSGGNLSILDRENVLWITPSRLDKGNLRREHIVSVRSDGTTDVQYKPSSEYPFHQQIYTVRPDLRAIVHAHPIALVAFSICGEWPNTSLFHRAHVICGEVGFAPYALPGSVRLGQNIAAEFAKGVNCVMLENHGVVVGGTTLQEAFERFETLEFTARILLKAKMLGNEIKFLSAAQLTLAEHRQTALPEFVPPDADSWEKAIRRELCEFVQRGYQQRLLTSTQGSFSARVKGNIFVITPYQVDRAKIEPADLVLIDSGRQEQGKDPSQSICIHHAIYQRHPEIEAIVLATPPNATAFCVTSQRLDTRTIPESYIFLRDVHHLPFSEAYGTGASLADIMSPEFPIALIENTGALVMGRTILDAFDRLEVLESTADALINAQALGSVHPMNEDTIKELIQVFLQ